MGNWDVQQHSNTFSKIPKLYLFEQLMKHTIYEKEFAPLMKNTNRAMIGNSRRKDIRFNTNPETPIRLKTQYHYQTCKQSDFDNYFKSPLQTNQLLSNSKYSQDQQLKHSFHITDSGGYSKSFVHYKNGYNQYVEDKQNSRTKRSQSSFELREILAYIQQILGDLIDKGNYGLAKRYAQKLGQTPLREKISRLISKIQEIQTAKVKRDKNSELPRQSVQNKTIQAMSQQLKQRNTKLDKQKKQMHDLYLNEKGKLRQQYETIYKKVYEENNKMKKQLEGKSRELDREQKENGEFKCKYEQMFENVNEELKEIRRQYDTIKNENQRLMNINQQISLENMQIGIKIKAHKIRFQQYEERLNELQKNNSFWEEQVRKIESLHLKFKNYLQSFNNQPKILPQKGYNSISEEREQSIPTCVSLNKTKDKNYIPFALKDRDIDEQKVFNQAKIHQRQFQKTIRSFQQNIDEVSSQIKVKHQRLQCLSRNCEVFQAEIHKKIVRLKQYEEKVQLTEAECLKYEVVLKSMIEQIQNSINMGRTQKVSCTNLTIAIREFEYYITQQNEQIKRVQILKGQMLASKEQIQRKLNNNQSQLQVKIKQLAALDERIQQNQEFIRGQERRLMQIRQHIEDNEDLKQECQQTQLRISELIKICTGFQNHLDNINRQIIHKNEYKQTLQKEIDCLTSELSDKNQKMKNLAVTQQILYKQIAVQNNILKNIQNNAEFKRQQIFQRQAHISTNQERLQKLKVQIKVQQKKISDLQGLNNSLLQQNHRISNMQPLTNEQMADLQMKKQMLRRQIFKSQQIISKQTLKIQQNQQIINKYQHLQNEVSQFQQQSKRLQEDINNNIIQLSQYKFQLEKIKSQYENVGRELDEKKRQIELHVVFVEESLASIQKLNEQMNFWQNQLERLRIKSGELQSEILLRGDELLSIQRQIQSRRNYWEQKEEQLNNLQQYQTMQNQISSEKVTLRAKSLEANDQNITSILQIQFNNSEILKKEIQQLLTSKEAKKKEIDRLNEILVLLQSDIWLKGHQLRSQCEDQYSQTNFTNENELIRNLNE